MLRPGPRIAICGPSRCGKDEASRYLASITGLRVGRTTSEVICPHVAKRLQIPEKEAFANRHANRHMWFEVGNELRAIHGANYLVSEVLKDSDFAIGIRNRMELELSIARSDVTLAIWIQRDVPFDPTIEYGPSLCDVTVENDGTLERFHARLWSIARFGGLLR